MLVNIVVHCGYCMASNIILFRKLATEYTTEQSNTERGGTAQKKGGGVTHHTRQHYSALELNNKFQFSDTKGALNQTKILPVSLQEIKPQNLLICSFVHNSVTLPLEKQTTSSETTANSLLHQTLIFL